MNRDVPSAARVVVFSMAGIGDTLMATPVLRELRRMVPGARIEVVVMWAGSAQLLEGNPNVDAVHAFNLIERPVLEGLRFLTGLRRPRADVSLTLFPQARREYRLVARWVGARRRLGHLYGNEGAIDRWLLPDAIPHDCTVSCAENNLRLLERIGRRAPPAELRGELFLSDDERAWAMEWCRKEGLAGRPWAGIHVGSGGTKNLALRRWPVERWAEWIGLWHARRPDVPLVAFGGPGEREVHEALRAALPEGALRFAVAPSLRASAALLSMARGFVSVDTAFMHLAAATRVPHQVVIETPTLNPPVHPMRPDWVRVENPAVGGRPLDFYRYDGGPIAGTDEALRRMMASVDAESVFAAMARGL